MKNFLRGILLALLFSAPFAFAENKSKIVIAIQPTATPEKLASQAQTLEALLEQKTGYPVEIFFPTSYAGTIEALRFGHAHAAFMGAWPAKLAIDKAGAQLVLAEIREVMIGEEKKEMPYYYSYWVVPKDSPDQSLADLKGKKAAFPSQLSTSGFVAPLSKLIDQGLLARQEGLAADPAGFFSEVYYSGGYAQAYEAMKSGQVNTTIIAGDVPETLYHEVLSDSKVIETQGPIPSHAVLFAKDLDANIAGNLKAALLNLEAPEEKALMRQFVSGIFVRFEEASNRHIENLSQMLEKTGFEFKEKK